MKSQHAPTPWEIVRQSGDDKDDFLAIFAKAVNKQPVTVLFMGGSDAHSAFKNYKANAAFIVKAVNCHEELIAALEAAIEQIKSSKEFNAPIKQSFHVKNLIENNLKKALNKAK